MNLDQFGLPVQADGDANDQLQRVGMILVAESIKDDDRDLTELDECCVRAVANQGLLQPQPGVFLRHALGDPDDVSADQLIAVLGAFIAIGSQRDAFNMLKTCLKRFGFAQNKKDGLNDSKKTKLPDFMLIRALPLFCRVSPLLYPVACLADTLLVALALSAVGPVWKDGGGFKSRDPGDVDDNDTILTLAVCRARFPTLFSCLAIKIYAKLRPWNYGRDLIGTDSNVLAALRWYHRPASGGNPEIAEMWKPIIERYF